MKSLMPWRRPAKDVAAEDGSSLPELKREIDSLFEEFFEGGTLRPLPHLFGGLRARDGRGDAGFAPEVDVTETDAAIVVRAELPGVDPKELELTLHGDLLSLAGQKSESRERKEGRQVLSERIFGAFRRSVSLPAAVDFAKGKATFEHGVLTVELPKTQPTPSRKLKIESR